MNKSALFIIFVFVATLSFAVSKDDLSLSAQNSINKMERAIAAAKKTAKTELTSQMKNEMKNGNIDKAMVLDKIIKSLDAETSSIISEKGSRNEYEDDIIGTWESRDSHSRMTFSKDGSCTVRSVRITDGMSTWKIESKKLIVTHKKLNTTETYDLPPKEMNMKGRKFTVLEGKTSTGEPRTMFRRQAD